MALQPLRGQHILITGGTGFMGSWLTEMIATLNERYGFGTQVTLLAREVEQYRTLRPHIGGASFVSLMGADVREVVEFPPDVTYVIHAAATPDNRVHATDPIGTMATIARGTARVMYAAERLPELRSLLLVSSGLTYGPQPLDMPTIPETYAGGLRCDSVTAAYAEAKRYSESFGYAHKAQYKLPVVFARPFAFIGPYQALDKPWAVNNFVRDALAGGPIRILGDGDTVRSYMYPSDMAYWVLKMLVAGGHGDVYNLGSDEPVSLRELAEKIAGLAGGSPRIETRRGGRLPVSRFVPDVSKARSDLGLGISVGLDEALSRTIEWHRQERARS